MSLPDLPNTKAANFLERVRETLQTMLGRVNPEDRLVTVGELVDSGLAGVSTGNIGGGGAVLTPPGGGSIGGGDVPPYVPDLSVPPTPTGLVVTAGLTAIFIETDAPAFTAGHGYARTLVYGQPYSGGALPVYGEGVTPILTEFVGEVGDYPVDPGEEWHIWLKWRSFDGVDSAVAGGTNGVSATSAKVGNSDLSDDIITADKLAAGAIDALDKFVPGIEPIYIVATLPNPVGYAGTKTVYLNSDGKLYRYVGGTWTAEIPASDVTGQIGITQIADNAITTPKLAANAVIADKVQAGAIIAGKIAASAIVAGDGVISNAAITNALIANAAITDAKVSNLSASKLTAGAISAGEYVRSSNYVAGSAGWNISGSGVAEFSNVTVRGTIYATGGTIGSVIIGPSYMISTNYAASSAGWGLSSNGSAQLGGIQFDTNSMYSVGYTAGVAGFKLLVNGVYEFNAGGTFRGTLAVASGASGARLEITNSVIKVFDAGGVVRVKLGDLS